MKCSFMPQCRDKGEGLAIAERHLIDEPHPMRPVPVEPHHLEAAASSEGMIVSIIEARKLFFCRFDCR
jgi:hypothetical protein